MIGDLRYSLRAIAAEPVPATVVVVAVGVAVALVTVIFSGMFTLMWRPLPIPSPSEVVYLYQTPPDAPDRPRLISRRVLDALRTWNQTFADLSGTWRVALRMTVGEEAEDLQGEQFSPGILRYSSSNRTVVGS